MKFNFIGAIDNESGTLQLMRMEDGHIVLTLTITGVLTLLGPNDEVLRSYESAEVETRQHEIDKEVEAAYDAVYQPHFGRAVMDAFSVVGDALEALVDEEPSFSFSLPPTIN